LAYRPRPITDENQNAFVSLLDDRDTVMRKFKRAVTDSDTCVKYAEGKSGINNLMSIYSSVTGKDFAEIEREFEGKGYGDFKLAVGEAVADTLAPIKSEFDRISKDKAYLNEVCKNGAEFAQKLSRRTLDKVYHKVGFVVK
jgi:tryptophanyl-tRNA synthetase